MLIQWLKVITKQRNIPEQYSQQQRYHNFFTKKKMEKQNKNIWICGLQELVLKHLDI